MTETRTPRRKLSAWPVITGAVALFCVVFALLSAQMRAGNDPALGTSVFAKTPISAQAPRRILVRRIVDDEVVTKVIVVPRGSSAGSTPLVTSSSGGGGGTSVTQSAPIVTSAPAAVAAPASAPLVTRTS